MQYVRLGNTGLKVSRLCLGMMTYGSKQWREWMLDEGESRPLIKAALEAGINFFDTADVYSIGVSEEITGRALRDFARREEIIIATKVNGAMGSQPNNRGLSRKHIMQSIDDSLRRLGTEYIDLYQIHRFDPETPIEETLQALHDIVRAGKALYIGASSMYAWQFITMQHTAERHGWTRFVAMQNHYNLVYREEEREMIPYCQATGVGLIPWSPLARGFLAGNRPKGKQDGETLRSRTDNFAHQLYYQEADFAVANQVGVVAQKYGVKPAQIALAWMLQKGHISAPIIGVSKPYQLSEAVSALTITLEAEDIAALESPYAPHPVLGH
ncbi:MAG TPA: aldo/keto reductase [Aggregatilineales bacterium]|nr:aldo/keto reductase [Anaerolineales bacterium]HRE46283.1 aldo/keto reductase [Aggregatilineales bacterium]